MRLPVPSGQTREAELSGFVTIAARVGWRPVCYKRSDNAMAYAIIRRALHLGPCEQNVARTKYELMPGSGGMVGQL